MHVSLACINVMANQTSLLFYVNVCWIPGLVWHLCKDVRNNGQNRPYSEQRRDSYESEAVRDRLTLFSVAPVYKSHRSPNIFFWSFLSTEGSLKDVFLQQHNRKMH